MPLIHLSDLPQKGSYAVYEMPTFDTSLLVIRGNLEWPSGDIEDTFPMERFGFLI